MKNRLPGRALRFGALACFATGLPALAQSTTSGPASSPSSGPIATSVTPPPSHGAGACAGQEMIVSTSTGAMYRIDNYATAPTAVALTPNNAGSLGDIAVDPTTGTVYGITFPLVDIVEVDLNTGNTTYLSTIPIFQNAADFSPSGTLYTWGTDFTVYETDPLTAIQVPVASATDFSAGDLAVDLDGTILGTGNTGQLYRWDPTNGSEVALGNMGLGPFVYGIEVDCNGDVYVTTNAGDMYTIDTTTLVTTPLGNIGIGELVYGMAFTMTDGGQTPPGTNYCGPAVPNSSGNPAVIAASGSAVAADNNLMLSASDLPTNQFGYFLNSQTQAFVFPVPNSQGALCIGGAIGRYNAQVFNTGSAGTGSVMLDLTQTPTPTGNVSIAAGETWNFTCWFRDNNPSPTSNFTDGVSVAFN